MSNYKYTSHFKNYIIDFLEYREKVLNQKTHPCNCYLYLFDKYCVENKIEKITKETVDNWLVLRKNENKNTLSIRSSAIKAFAKYLNMKGIEAYVVNTKYYPRKNNYLPHIFTVEEIKTFFKKLDDYLKQSSHINNYTKIQYKMFFKILYCTGMRDSELLNIKYEDINFNDKTLIVKKSKNDITRLIYLNDDLISDLKEYHKRYCNNELDKYIFSYKNKVSYCRFNVIFHNVINICNFNSSDKYRIHDLRHTFAVKNLNIAFKNNIDTYIILPTLMTFMGHSSITSTEYYLRFISDVYPNVLEKMEEKFSGIIPKIGEVNKFVSEWCRESNKNGFERYVAEKEAEAEARIAKIEDSAEAKVSKTESKGKKAGILETAKNLLTLNIDLKSIEKATGLSEKELNKLKNQIC